MLTVRGEIVTWSEAGLAALFRDVTTGDDLRERCVQGDLELVRNVRDRRVSIRGSYNQVRPARRRTLVVDRREQWRWTDVRARQHLELRGHERPGVRAIFGASAPVVGAAELEPIDLHARPAIRARLHLASREHLRRELGVARNLERVVQRSHAVAGRVLDRQPDRLL